MPSPISLLVDYPKEIIRAGLRSMLEKTRITIVGEAGDAENTLALARKHKPDVSLIDAALPIRGHAQEGPLGRGLRFRFLGGHAQQSPARVWQAGHVLVHV